MLTRKINSTTIWRTAIFDVLFSQCDRHQQNLFITEAGEVSLIDNDQARPSAITVVPLLFVPLCRAISCLYSATPYFCSVVAPHSGVEGPISSPDMLP